MPSTTNTLESMHGYINAKCPRKNSFFSAISKLISELDSKYFKINERIQHNYRFSVNSTISRLHNAEPNEIEKMIAFYDTMPESCLCGQNVLTSSNYKIDIPCMHRISIGATFPEFQKIDLSLVNQYAEMKIDYVFTQNLYLPLKVYNEKEYIIQTIKHFSKFKKLDEIVSFVESYEKESDPFYIDSYSIQTIQ